MTTSPPDLDDWLPDASVRVLHRRECSASPGHLWEAARAVRLHDTPALERMVHWRIPGLARDLRFIELFRSPPFMVLEEREQVLVSGLVGRIWTLRRDYPQLRTPGEFSDWDVRGTARVAFANWSEALAGGGSILASETRVQGIGLQGRIGITAIGPLVRGFQSLVSSEGLRAAVRVAEDGSTG